MATPNTAPGAQERPNVILICVDQWRGDCLGYLGHPVVETPYLDALAGEGACFTQAYTATPSCIPARAALYTGLSQTGTGRVGYKDGVPWDYPVTVASEFTRHGYQTQAVGKLHVYPERSQIGFQNVILHDGYLHFARRGERDMRTVDDYLPWLREKTGEPDADYFGHGLSCNAYTVRPWDRPEHLHPTNFIVTQGLDFLRRRDPRKPFFLYLGFHRPHPPLDPPAWAYEMYADAPMPDPPRGDWTEILEPHRTQNRPDPQVATLAPRALQRARAGYYGHMTHIDHQINRLMEGLQEFGVKSSTYACFVSDHGDLLGDHDCWRKTLPYDGSARVPLLLWGPQAAPEGGIKRGTRCDAVAELRDVMPTLLDCAGLPIPESVEGRSLLPFARGEVAPDWRPFLHGEHTGYGQSIHYLTDGREKYVWWSGTGTEQLFDLVNDPQETHDLARAGANEARVAAWRARLIDTLRDRPEGFVGADGSLITGRPVRPMLPTG